MEVDLLTYEALVRRLQVPTNSCPNLSAAARDFGVSPDAACSIFAGEVQERAKKGEKRMMEALPDISGRFFAGADLVELSAEHGFPPSLVLRRLLREPPLSFGPAVVKAILKDPLGAGLEKIQQTFRERAWIEEGDGVDGERDGGEARGGERGGGEARGGERGGGEARDGDDCDPVDGEARGGACERDRASDRGGSGAGEQAPASATAPPVRASRLSLTAHEACLADMVYSPASEEQKRRAGEDAEGALERELRRLRIPFWSERELRRRSFFKTPDALLRVPVAVDGRVVCWVDSKATFGDPRTHAELAATQLQGYVNRFGSGLVVYWHGLVQPPRRDDGITAVACWPADNRLTLLDCLDLETGEVIGGARGRDGEAAPPALGRAEGRPAEGPSGSNRGGERAAGSRAEAEGRGPSTRADGAAAEEVRSDGRTLEPPEGPTASAPDAPDCGAPGLGGSGAGGGRGAADVRGRGEVGSRETRAAMPAATATPLGAGPPWPGPAAAPEGDPSPTLTRRATALGPPPPPDDVARRLWGRSLGEEPA